MIFKKAMTPHCLFRRVELLELFFLLASGYFRVGEG